MSFSLSLRALFITCALASLSSVGVAWADPHTPSRAGTGQPVSFSTEQVAHGAQLYAANCAMCHGTNLEGGHDMPDLGPYFTARWAGAPLDRLASAISHAAPLMAPNALPPQDTAALMAFVLHQNGVSSTTNAPLPMEEARLAKIHFPAEATTTPPPATDNRP